MRGDTQRSARVRGSVAQQYSRVHARIVAWGGGGIAIAALILTIILYCIKR